MKATGIVRKVDKHGRIVLPIELRRTFGIQIKTAIETYVDDDYILLKKYEPSCVFCGNKNIAIQLKGKRICEDCMRELLKF